jgi:hypothetical protein
MFARYEVWLENEREDQAENGEGFSQGEAQERDGLQDALSFRLACNTVDVCGEHEANTDTTADCGQTVTYEVESAFHFSSFQDASSVAGCLGCFIPAAGEVEGA